jgi:catechol 2,3-dioxygenase-like lactoylglutathione lyase family enzyme
VLLGIDHLVVAVPDPEAAARRLEQRLGLAVTGGGRHEQAGTFNRLAFLGDTYLELIGVFDTALVRSADSFAVGRASLALLAAGRQGLATYALATDDLDRDVRALWADGSPIGEPVAGSRVRPDGGVVRWSCAFPDLGPEAPPFLIEHELAGAEWDAGARAARADFRHPTGGRVRLVALELPVREPRAAADGYAVTVGVRFDPDLRAGVGPQELRLRPADGLPPVVELAAEPGTSDLDVVLLGVRWRRRGWPDAAFRR